jgi:tRNA(fMet)-specific endonuclease VapC
VQLPERSRFEMVVLDTDIMVSLLKDEEAASEKIEALEQSGEKICTTVVTAYELLKGAQISTRREENLALVRDLISNVDVLSLSIRACEQASRIYKRSRQLGKLIGEFDILIAAITISSDQKLVSKDGDFKSIQGLEITHW